MCCVGNSNREFGHYSLPRFAAFQLTSGVAIFAVCCRGMFLGGAWRSVDVDPRLSSTEGKVLFPSKNFQATFKRIWICKRRSENQLSRLFCGNIHQRFSMEQFTKAIGSSIAPAKGGGAVPRTLAFPFVFTCCTTRNKLYIDMQNARSIPLVYRYSMRSLGNAPFPVVAYRGFLQ